MNSQSVVIIDDSIFNGSENEYNLNAGYYDPDDLDPEFLISYDNVDMGVCA